MLRLLSKMNTADTGRFSADVGSGDDISAEIRRPYGTATMSRNASKAAAPAAARNRARRELIKCCGNLCCFQLRVNQTYVPMTTAAIANVRSHSPPLG